MSRRVRFGLAILILLLGGVAAAVIGIGARSLDEPLRISSALRFKVPAGASFARIAGDLGAQGVIAQPKVWALFARWKGVAPLIKAGEYEVQPGTTPRELLMKMVAGQVLLHSFTIVDGWRVADMLDALRRNPDVLSTLGQAAAPPDLMARLGSPGLAAEGQFLPETYKFVAGTSDIELLRQAHAALAHELDSAWTNRDQEIPLHSPYELLIMASIVEKESGVPQEIGKIAGLYQHRLAIGMRLQADPTVIYGMGERYEGDIRTVDLRTDGPYNSYTRTGLPPTPIALASAAVIRATARPEKTDALYFVASPKSDGSHVFSATLEQHNLAVASYLARKRQ
jgi:UPF0755 protein